MKTPKYLIKSGGRDITSSLHIVALTYTDYERDNIDSLSLTLAPTASLVDFGTRIDLFLGYDKLYFIGAFYITSILRRYKLDYKIEATSINFDKSFKIKKSRSFNMSYGDALRTIARENNLKTKLDFNRIDEVATIMQFDESDSSICASLASALDCSFCVKNDTLIFLDHDKSFDRKTYEIKADDCLELQIERNNKTTYNSCTATYHDLSIGAPNTITYGTTPPILYRTFITAKDASEALAKAKTSLSRANRKSLKGSLTAPFSIVFAGGYLHLYLDGDKQKHLITSVTHNITPTTATTKVDFE